MSRLLPTHLKRKRFWRWILFCRRAYYANDNGGLNNRTASWDIEARLIDDDGVALGGWITLGSESITENTNTASRRTYKYTVPAGRYEVRGIRTNAKDTSARAGSDLNWNALKAYLW